VSYRVVGIAWRTTTYQSGACSLLTEGFKAFSFFRDDNSLPVLDLCFLISMPKCVLSTKELIFAPNLLKSNFPSTQKNYNNLREPSPAHNPRISVLPTPGTPYT